MLLLDSDMVAVDIWQLMNSTARWARAERELQNGAALVLPGFQLVPPIGADESWLEGDFAMHRAMEIITAGVHGFTYVCC